jgi:hypothetical protein
MPESVFRKTVAGGQGAASSFLVLPLGPFRAGDFLDRLVLGFAPTGAAGTAAVRVGTFNRAPTSSADFTDNVIRSPLVLGTGSSGASLLLRSAAEVSTSQEFPLYWSLDARERLLVVTFTPVTANASVFAGVGVRHSV